MKTSKNNFFGTIFIILIYAVFMVKKSLDFCIFSDLDEEIFPPLCKLTFAQGSCLLTFARLFPAWHWLFLLT